MTPEDRLTGEQRRLIDELCGEWEARAARPDRRDAERALGELLDRRGMRRPKTVIWLDSPLAGAIAARVLLDGDFAASGRDEPSGFEEHEPYAPRWRLPEVASAYRFGHDKKEPALRAVLARIGEPAWAINGAVSARIKEEALSPAAPALFAEISAGVHERLTERLPVGLEQVALLEAGDALKSGAGPPPGHWKQWRHVWPAVNAPENPALLILSALRGDADRPRARLRLAAAVGWWWTAGDVAVLTPPPAEVHTDDQGRLHREDGPAVRYRDGFAQYCWRGHVVPPDLIEPGWDVADIAHASDDELLRRAVEQLGSAWWAAGLPAAEVVPDLRRCALERVGWARFAAEAPAPEPELLARIRRSDRLRDVLARLDFDLDCAEHVEEVHLAEGARLEAIGGHGTGGTYFLCGDGPRRPVLYADSEGGYQVLGRDLAEALQFMVSADRDGGGPEEVDEEAAQALGLRPLSPEEYRSRQDEAEAMAAALTLVMTEEGNAYEYRRSAWFR